MKNSNGTIGNRNRDLPACSAVPLPIAPPRAPNKNRTQMKLGAHCFKDHSFSCSKYTISGLLQLVGDCVSYIRSFSTNR
jgi:hypothetical protein